MVKIYDKDERMKKNSSMYVQYNKMQQMLIALVVLVAVTVTVVVIGKYTPASKIWTNNVLLQMIIDTHRAVTGK
ncbi:hypothetical protein FACS1894167_04260 [Synergistales bacterium]|nr:hypothetical protein FACS1894167_04260 [Synergistales bacterium]